MFTYDGVDRLQETTYPLEGAIPAETVTQSFTDTDQLTRVSGSTPYVSDIHYDLFGRQRNVFYGNGVVDEKEYSDRTGNFRLKAIETWKGAVTYQDLSYATYDPVGNFTQINDALFAPSDGRHNTQSYTYDGLYRMIGSSGPHLDTCSYGYDPIGNITNKCGLIYHYSTTHPHRLISTSGAASMDFAYDPNGNLKTKSGPKGYSNQYDFDDRLKTITPTVGALTVTHTYDYSGRRVMKSSAAGTVRYFGDLVEVEGGIVRRHYFALGARVASREQGTTTSLLFYQADHLSKAGRGQTYAIDKP